MIANVRRTARVAVSGCVRALHTSAAGGSGLSVAITGAEGGVGTVLCHNLSAIGHRIVAVTHASYAGPALDGAAEQRQADLRDATQAAGIFDGCDAVVHLAALPLPYEPWNVVYSHNVAIDGVVMAEAARTKGVSRLVYASSNHCLHGYSMGASPEELNDDPQHGYGAHLPPNRARLLTLADEPRPDSFYACGKLMGEALGSYALHSSRQAQAGEGTPLSVVALRIGWVVPNDDPTSVAPHSLSYMRAMWLSHRDAAATFDRALRVQLPPHELGFGVAFACSMNTRRVFDLEESVALLGGAPVDNAEHRFDTDHIPA